MLSFIRDRLQLDRPLAFALLTRTWQAVSGPITIVLLISAFTLPEQGVYYSIIGVIGIQAYFELGLLNVLVSHSGHEAAAMNEAAAGGAENLESNPQWMRAAARMRDLIHASFKWFTVAAVLYAISALAFGWYTLAESQVNWHGPLLAVVPVAAVSVCLAPALAILEGAGYRDLIYRFRFIQMAIGSLAVWLALATGLKLWALVISSLLQACMAAYITFVVQAPFFSKFRRLPRQQSAPAENHTHPSSDFVWSRDVVPVQWRVALISATFHFATQFFVIIVTKFHSDAEAAPLGMTLSVTGAIQMLALAWVQTKYPVVSAHHGAGDRQTAGTIWRRTAIISTSLLLVACASLVAIVACLPRLDVLLDMEIEKRFLSPWLVVVLSVGCLSNHIASVQGFYVLSRRAKPLLVASLIGSISTGLAVWIAGYYYASVGVVTGYALAMTLVLVPVHSWAYYRFRQRTDV